jgi:polysaccharide deacetylase family protein (PEP-CTERM system associated)
VGRVARRYPTLVGEIISRGHEVACHGDTHEHLDTLGPNRFRDDLRSNLSAITDAGARDIRGFRAPTFSLTATTAWAHEILSELGFAYSSSVLPAKNPLYGWPGFGSSPRRINGLWEIPMSVHPFFPLRFPIAGGVYFRLMPFPLIKTSTRILARQGLPIPSYLHPYDIDAEQERFMHPDLNNNRLLNFLMYVNRRNVLSRLDRLRQFCNTMTYENYVKSLPAPT